MDLNLKKDVEVVIKEIRDIGVKNVISIYVSNALIIITIIISSQKIAANYVEFFEIKYSSYIQILKKKFYKLLFKIIIFLKSK